MSSVHLSLRREGRGWRGGTVTPRCCFPRPPPVRRSPVNMMGLSAAADQVSSLLSLMVARLPKLSPLFFRLKPPCCGRGRCKRSAHRERHVHWHAANLHQSFACMWMCVYIKMFLHLSLCVCARECVSICAFEWITMCFSCACVRMYVYLYVSLSLCLLWDWCTLTRSHACVFEWICLFVLSILVMNPANDAASAVICHALSAESHHSSRWLELQGLSLHFNLTFLCWGSWRPVQVVQRLSQHWCWQTGESDFPCEAINVAVVRSSTPVVPILDLLDVTGPPKLQRARVAPVTDTALRCSLFKGRKSRGWVLTYDLDYNASREISS